MPRCVRRSSDGNGQCTHDAQPGSVLCQSCGANLPGERRAAAERAALAQLIVVNTTAAVIEEAMGVLVSVMRHGEKDSDRLRAVDRVLELSGVMNSQPIVAVQVNTGLRPQEDNRDARLLSIIEKMSEERAATLRERAIGAISHEVESA